MSAEHAAAAAFFGVLVAGSWWASRRTQDAWLRTQARVSAVAVAVLWVGLSLAKWWWSR